MVLEYPLSAYIYVICSGIIFGLVFFYLLGCLIARKFLKPDFYILSLYVSVAFLVAIMTEPVHDTVYKYFFGEYLWIYQIFPIFGGGSTMLAPLAWSFYGYYAYFFQRALFERGIHLRTWVKGLLPGLDGVPYDMTGNLFALFIAHKYFFFYPRTELWHLSSWWVIPFYTISGFIYAYVLRYTLFLKRSWKLPVVIYCMGIVLMLVGEYFYRLL